MAVDSSDSNMILRTVYLDPEVDRRLRAYAYEENTTKNEVIRLFINHALAELAKGAKGLATLTEAVGRRSSAQRKPASKPNIQKNAGQKTAQKPAKKAKRAAAKTPRRKAAKRARKAVIR